ncbi:MAG: YidB family protein [Enterobacteriaceae bacterium]|jgi:uncharacterized protein YidB (DUF937 family)|nr:YidB family protein [Enterobacteriaceae bacterium]
MGLLDQLGGLLGGGNSASNGSVDYTAILQWVEQQGGISGLLDKLRQGGLTEEIKSWISTGANASISAQQIQNALNSDALQQLAAKLGINIQEASGIIAQYLPELVNKLSPQGNEPQNSDLLSQGLSLLKSKFLG